MLQKYRHQFVNGVEMGMLPGKVVCIGRNYADHAAELNNPVPTTPLLFIKPSTSIVCLQEGFALPEGKGECHHEVELSVLIGEQLTNRP